MTELQHLALAPYTTRVNAKKSHLTSILSSWLAQSSQPQNFQNIFKVKKLAKFPPITPGVSQNSLLCTVKFADAIYITIFDKDTVNIYNANNTIITVTKGAILRGWQDKNSNLWHIPLVCMVQNLNTDSVLLNHPPSKFPLNRPDPAEAVHSVY